MILDFPSSKLSRKLAEKYGYAEFVVRRWLNFFGDETEDIIKAFEHVPKYIRLNTIKIDEEGLMLRLKSRGFKVVNTEVPYCYEVVEEPYSVGATPEFLMGYYYVMDKSSCVPPLALDAKPGELILDMAASPGGKTTMVSMLMENRGALIALEPQSERIQPLIDNVNRMGAFNVAVLQMDGREVGKLGLKFDRVLLDAPCSGEGVIYKDPDRKVSMSAKDVIFCSSLQRQLILAAFDVLREGGVLVYSTCTLAPEENEFVVDYLLSKRENAKVERIPWGDRALELESLEHAEVSKCSRFYPHRHRCAGFFVARIRKV
ncbi:MAG: NOL1/NOP2/sun family putative RNA methylase [Archaeoglobaceae archaeon]